MKFPPSTLKVLFSFILMSAFWGSLHSQTTIRGSVKAEGKPVPFASVKLVDAAYGTTADSIGRFRLAVAPGKYLLEVTSTGFEKATLPVLALENKELDVTVQLLPLSGELNSVVVLGSRSLPRTNILSPLPVDVLSSGFLVSTGQLTLDKQLQYRVPSFNSINVPVRDASTFFDPYELRNLGPSRTLILINGKRKNSTSLLYVQFAPGRGETGVDLSTIPVDAVKRIEILRDGASPQYGSDAIAGVINIILKDKFEVGSLTINSGITTQGDGGSYGISYNGGASFKKNSFVNYTIDISQQNNAVRSGIIDRKVEKLFFGGTPKKDSLIDAFLDLYPTARNVNGTGDNAAAKFNINFGVSTGDDGMIYGNAGLVKRKSLSKANYRTPYWRTDAGLLHIRIPGAPNYTGLDDPLYEGYLGYVPTFEGDLLDYQFTIGFKKERNHWIQDASFTAGGNSQNYTVENTVNRSLGTSSPTFFKPGGFGFSHIVGNYDVSKELTKKISVAFGAEVRSETYEVISGDTASYYGEGANSFPGMLSDNASVNGRFNMGFYGDATYNFSQNTLLNAAARWEKYSDFGEAFVWKISGRQKLLTDRVVFRSSVSTGFRAPTLHQIYTQSTVLSYISNNIELTGLFNNRSKQAFLLGIPRLKAEKSLNISAGVGLRLGRGWEVTLDYYSIHLRDRIFYSSGISARSPNTPLGQVLKNAGVVEAQFFLNGLETQCSGLDFVMNYRVPTTSKNKLSFNIAGNLQIENYIVGRPNDPPLVRSEGQSTLSPTIRLLLTDSRPKYKTIAGIDYNYNRLGVTLNHTLFGTTKYQDIDGGGPEMQNIQQVFKPAVLTDINFRYRISDQISFSFSVNNLFNVLPQWDLKPINSTGEQYLRSKENRELLEGLVSFGGRYRILGASGSQFSQLGTTLQSSFVIKL